MITRVIEYDKLYIDTQFAEMAEAVGGNDNFNIVKKLKETVPEYRSANSEFERLDR